MKKIAKIYLASSWRNSYQAEVLETLRTQHEVYDFKNPSPGDTGFKWKDTDPLLESDLTVGRLRTALRHPAAVSGFKNDFDAMKWADICVLLLPCGRSAHLEAGWFAGAVKPVLVLAPEINEPELMYKCFDTDGFTPIYESIDDVMNYLAFYEEYLL